METPLIILTAVYARRDPDLVTLRFNDGTQAGLYLEDGSPRTMAHDLLDEWIAEGNTIADPAT